MDLSTPPSSAATNLIDPTNNTNTNQTTATSFQTTSTSPINTQQHVSTVDAVDIAKNQTTIVSSMSSNKKVTIAQPTLQAKQSLHGFSPSESGKSGSSFSQSKITLRTCCGVVELTSMKLACLIGMVVTVVGLLILAAIAIASFVTASSKSTDILIGIGEVSTLFESSNAYVFRYVYTNAPKDPKFPEVQLGYYNQTQIAQNLLVNILAKLDNAEVKYVFNETTIQALNSIARENVQILVYFNGEQSEDARRKLVAPLYTETISSFRYGLDQIIEFIQTKEKEKDTQILAVTLVQLIVIVVSLFVVMPIIIFVFTYAINRDSLYLEKIRRANAIMLMDTMEDDGLRALFKLHCEKEKSSENYLLLEKIQFYRSLCERSLELQAKLFKDDPNSDASSDISAESASSAAKKKKESPLEREYNEVEAKKYEVAFEIFTEFLEVTGDMAVNISHVLVDSVKDKLDKFNDKQLDTLPDDMFNVLEKETCLVMMDTHHRFKQSLAFQREMKIDKIKVDKLKKKKLPDF